MDLIGIQCTIFDKWYYSCTCLLHLSLLFAVDFGEAQKVAYVFNDDDSVTSVPDMEFSVAEPVILSTSEMKRTSPL